MEDPDHKSTTHNVLDPLVLQNSYTIRDGVFTVSSPPLRRVLYSFYDRSPYSHSCLADPNLKCGAGCSSMTSKRHRNPAICEHSRKTTVTQQTTSTQLTLLEMFPCRTAKFSAEEQFGSRHADLSEAQQ